MGHMGGSRTKPGVFGKCLIATVYLPLLLGFCVVTSPYWAGVGIKKAIQKRKEKVNQTRETVL